MAVKGATRLRAMIEAIIARGETRVATALLSGLYARAQTPRSRGGGSKSKAKGRKFAADVAATLVRAFNLEPEDVFVKATSQVGCDLHLSPHAAEAFPYSIEAKKVEQLNIWAALAQAEGNAEPGKPAVVFFSRAYSPIYVAISAEVFLELARRGQGTRTITPGSVRATGEG